RTGRVNPLFDLLANPPTLDRIRPYRGFACSCGNLGGHLPVRMGSCLKRGGTGEIDEGRNGDSMRDDPHARAPMSNRTAERGSPGAAADGPMIEGPVPGTLR